MAKANLSFEGGDSLFHQMTPFSKLLRNYYEITMR